MEIITKIKEVRDLKSKTIKRISYDGYKIETTKHNYYVLIDNSQDCCEEWGYMLSQDNIEYFINSQLLEVRTINTALNITKVKEKIGKRIDLENIQFVDFITNNGVFQLVIYNQHEGYYGHDILILKDDEILLSSIL